MKTILAGSRGIHDYAIMLKAIQASGFEISEVVCGTARGPDQHGARWAEENGISITCFKPDWKKYGRGAGLHRNKAMAEYADALIALWEGQSSGTKNMIDLATARGMKVFVFRVDARDHEIANVLKGESTDVPEVPA